MSSINILKEKTEAYIKGIDKKRKEKIGELDNKDKEQKKIESDIRVENHKLNKIIIDIDKLKKEIKDFEK